MRKHRQRWRVSPPDKTAAGGVEGATYGSRLPELQEREMGGDLVDNFQGKGNLGSPH
jgi:hypothetical protein